MSILVSIIMKTQRQQQQQYSVHLITLRRCRCCDPYRGWMSRCVNEPTQTRNQYAKKMSVFLCVWDTVTRLKWDQSQTENRVIIERQRSHRLCSALRTVGTAAGPNTDQRVTAEQRPTTTSFFKSQQLIFINLWVRGWRAHGKGASNIERRHLRHLCLCVCVFYFVSVRPTWRERRQQRCGSL